MVLTIGTFSQHYKDHIDQSYIKIKDNIKDNIKGNIKDNIQDSIQEQNADESIEFVVKVLDKKKSIIDSDPTNFEEIEILITHKLTQAELACFPKLKGIAVPMTGLDNFEKSVLETEGLIIENVHCLAPFVAERAVGIAMTLLGKIHIQDRDLKKNSWGRSTSEGQWTSLWNKKIGIYGYGAIGKAIENLLRPYNPKFYIIDRHKSYSDDLNLVRDLEELADSCDILFIAVPRSEETEGTVNASILNKMKNGFIINVGRGAVVNEKDLYQALLDKTIKGYGSDVWFNYPDKEHKEVAVSNYDLAAFDTVVMTPHNSWNTDEQSTLVEDETLLNLYKIAKRIS